MTLEEIVNNLKSAGQDYGQLFNNNPRMDATKQFGGRAINNINSAGEGYSQWQRLQDQNFGPNQSVIASGFMHPQKGLSKLADWFTNNVNTAAGLPDPSQQDEASMYAYGPNIDQQAESGLNLAGLLQTGAFASGAAPKSAGGTLGTFAGISAKTAPLDKFAKAEQSMSMSIKNPNLNFELLNKHLSGQKLTPKEMAQYEANGLAMETPQLQRYNVANANAQIPNDAQRMESLGMDTPSYHVSRNNEDILKFRNRINDTSLFNGLGTHSGTQKAATQRAKDTLGFNRDTGRKNPEMSSYYPLQLRANKSFELNGKPVDEYGAELYLDNLGRPLGMGRESDVGKEAIQDAYFKNNDVLKYINDVEDKGSISYISPPENIRSRFAAFDPLRKNSSNLLASGLLGSLLLKQMNQESSQK